MHWLMRRHCASVEWLQLHLHLKESSHSCLSRVASKEFALQSAGAQMAASGMLIA